MKQFKHVYISMVLAVLVLNCGTKDEGSSNSRSEETPGTEEEESAASLGTCGNEVSQKEPSSTSGQLQITLSGDADPCKVEGYIVGYPGQLDVTNNGSGSYTIDNVPVGKHDVILSSLAISTNLTDTDENS